MGKVSFQRKLMFFCMSILMGMALFFIYKSHNQSGIQFITDEPQVQIHESFNPLAYIDMDAVDKEALEVDASKVNTEQLGEYVVTYKYQDSLIEVLVTVVDQKEPEFTLHPLEVESGVTLTVSDLITDIQDDTKTTARFKEEYDFSKKGKVDVSVIVEDQAGNQKEKQTTVTVLGKDTKAPSIQGTRDLMVKKGSSDIPYLKGVVVSDDYDPNPAIEVDSKGVNIEEVGEYDIVYTAKDRSGNATKVKHKVSVVETKLIGSLTPSEEKVVYLTFDDGPSKHTEQILEILDRYQIQATFFVTGVNPDYFHLIKEAHTAGHTIGLHTYSHNYATIYSSIDEYYADLEKIGELCQQQIGYVPIYIRFPGGASNTISKKYCSDIMSFLVEDVQLHGYQYYDWNVSSEDGEGTLPAEEIVAASIDAKQSNILLLMHDANGKQTTVDALPKIIEHYLERGYCFAGLDDESYSPHHPVNN